MQMNVHFSVLMYVVVVAVAVVFVVVLTVGAKPPCSCFIKLILAVINIHL